MQPQSKRGKKSELTFMLLDGAGGNARRYRITQRHLLIGLVVWVLAMIAFAFLGFQIG